MSPLSANLVLANAVTNSSTPLVPTWIVMPCAILALLMLGGYLRAMVRASPQDIPASRRRIRVANTLVMMFTTPIAAFSFGVVVPAQQRAWVLSWTLLAGLVTIVLCIAAADVFNTIRLYRKARREIMRERAELLSGALPSARGT